MSFVTNDYDVLVAGAGWGGTAAAISAARRGSKVLLVERTDMVLGLGLVGGIFRNNGRFSAAEEGLALGGGGMLFGVMDAYARHVGIEFPGHRHASLYDVKRIEAGVRRALSDAGVELLTESRLVAVESGGGANRRVTGVVDEKGRRYHAGAFVDATGTVGPMGNCLKHGNGCAMCVMRCASFGPRVSLAAQVGVKEWAGERSPGRFGAMAGSCKLDLDSLDPSIRTPLERNGVIVVKLPPDMVNATKLTIKACQQYALEEFAENLVLLDTGYAKLMTPFFPLGALRSIPGFCRARYADPGAGTKANSMRFFAVSPRDSSLLVEGTENLFCAGEKCALQIGHTEAVVTGALAGYNASGYTQGLAAVSLPEEALVGDFIAHTGRVIREPGGTARRFTFAGAEYFRRMQELNLYSTDTDGIRRRLDRLGILGLFDRKHS